MIYKNYWKFFFLFSISIFFLIVDPIFAKQLKFKKEKHSYKTNFTYRFLDSKKNTQDISFSLATDLIENARQEIPSLAFLHQKIHTELPNKAHQISQKYLGPQEEKYRQHLLGLKNSIFKITSKLGAGFEFKINCPEETLQYKFQLDKEAHLSYSHRLSYQSCNFAINSDAAYQLLIQNWQSLIQQVKESQPEGFVYRIIKTKTGHTIESEIPANWNSSDRRKAQKILAKTNKSITASSKDFHKKQKILNETFQKTTTEYQVFYKKIEALINPTLEKISQKITSENEKEYAQHYLKIEKKGVQNIISPDYRSLVEDYRERMNVVSQAIREKGLSDKELLEKALNLLQSIPYDTLQNRDLESFTGFLSAYSLLDKNIGDCDSKSVALLSIAKTLTPQVESIMVLIPKHAFLAFAIPAKPEDKTILYQGKRYVVAEVAGPAVLPLGQVGKASESAIRKNTFEEILSF